MLNANTSPQLTHSHQYDGHYYYYYYYYYYYIQGSHSFNLKKIPGLFQDPQNVFPGHCHRTAILKYKGK